MARPTVPEIHCWEMSVEDLNIYLASTIRGALRIELALEKQYDCIALFRKLFPSTRLLKDSHLNLPLIKGVEAEMMNKQANVGIDFDFSCTPFQWKVYKAIKKIPFGETRSYGEVASMVGKPKGARAVGQALGKNPLPLIFQ